MAWVDGRRRTGIRILAAAYVSVLASSAWAAPALDDNGAAAPTLVSATPPAEQRKPAEPSPPSFHAADEVPRLGLVESAFGTTSGVVFAGLSGIAVSNSSEHTQAGVLLGGSPLRRLTLYGLFGRDGEGRFSPSATAQYAFLGGAGESHALSGLVQYKAEGFTEAGGELELGVLTGFHHARWYLNLGALTGFGLEEEEEGEIDAEGKARVGYDVLDSLRLGVLARFRERLAGDRRLAGGRNWDFIGGPEITGSFGPFVLAASGGPTTLGVSDGVGAYGMLTLAAASRF